LESHPKTPGLYVDEVYKSNTTKLSIQEWHGETSETVETQAQGLKSTKSDRFVPKN